MMLTDQKVIALPLCMHAAHAPRTSAAIHRLSEHREAQNSQQWLTMIVESSHDAIIGTSLHGIILSWNHAARRLFGYTAAHVMDQPVTTLFSFEDTRVVRVLITRSSQGEYIEGHEVESIRENGQRVNVSLTFSPIKDPSDAIVGVAMIARDISPRKRAQEQHQCINDSQPVPLLLQAANSDDYGANESSATHTTSENNWPISKRHSGGLADVSGPS